MTKVLVVEDEKHLAEGLRFNLEAEGYEVRVRDSGECRCGGSRCDVARPEWI